MALIASDRHRPDDLETWEQLARIDAVRASMKRLARKEQEAQSALHAFTYDDTSGYVGVSWGKDSVVVAHLARSCGLPVTWVKIRPLYNPDCELVRDAFLTEHDVEYHEIEVEWRPDQADRWQEHATRGDARLSLGWSPPDTAARKGFNEAARRFGARHISGVRAEESPVRTLRMCRWGHSSPNTCAPIGWWSIDDVFAYLSKHDLPIHPAYAMSFGGTLDRERIRVDAFGGGKGANRPEWEGRYYADRIRLIEQEALRA